MTLVHKKPFLEHQKKYLALIKKGRAFIYPTDTIYGIGCDATNTRAVKHIRILKQREHKPFSVIAPSKQWILKNCVVNARAKKWLGRLPGKYTFILHLKNKKAVSRSVHLGDYTIGVRIPKHWFASVVAAYGKPIVTTSVNSSGAPFMTSFHDIPSQMQKKVGFILYEGVKKAHPSTLVDFVSDQNGKIVKRKK
ncbi:threonylcarbamoyl-AMP synthase [Candidatus Woesearchaeota archaeon]|nr:threonylcarbamoyl-AMP synthase [Candidatus Woesearchaeota archaeon]